MAASPTVHSPSREVEDDQRGKQQPSGEGQRDRDAGTDPEHEQSANQGARKHRANGREPATGPEDPRHRPAGNLLPNP